MSSLLPAVEATSSALQAERTRLEVIAANLANAENTNNLNGEVYRRKQVLFESLVNTSANSAQSGGVRVAKIVEDTRPLQVVHMPGHPRADANGNVTLPNVNVLEEMVDMMTASRSYEANLQSIQTARQLFNSSLKISSAG